MVKVFDEYLIEEAIFYTTQYVAASKLQNRRLTTFIQSSNRKIEKKSKLRLEANFFSLKTHELLTEVTCWTIEVRKN